MTRELISTSQHLVTEANAGYSRKKGPEWRGPRTAGNFRGGNDVSDVQ